MIRFSHRFVLTAGVLAASCTTAALAETTFQFTVPLQVTLPASYTGQKTLTVACAVGGANLAFDAATGTASNAGVKTPAVTPTTVQLSSLRPSGGAAASGAGAGKDGAAGTVYTGTASFNLKIPEDLTAAGKTGVGGAIGRTPGEAGPTTYICWGLIGTNSAYATPPFVKGALPTIAK